MKTFGQVLVGIGAIFLILALLMDTSVPSGYGRVHNIGRMNDRLVFVLLGAVILLIGVVMALWGKTSRIAQTNTQGGSRRCPYCAETIKSQAVVCRFCGNKIDPLDSKESLSSTRIDKSLGKEAVAEQVAAITRRWLERIVARIEGAFSTGNSTMKPIVSATTTAFNFLSRHQRKFAGIIFIAFLIAMVGIYFRALQDLNIGLGIYLVSRYSSMFAAAVLFFSFPLNSKSSPSTNTSGRGISEGMNATEFLVCAEKLDLVPLQVSLVAAAFLLEGYNMTTAAISVAFLSLAVAVTLHRLQSKAWGIVTGLLAGGYILTVLYRTVDPHAGLMHSQERLLDAIAEGYYSADQYFLLLAVAVGVPHLERLSFGRFRFGRLPGDFCIALGTHRFKLNLLSTFLLWVVLFGTMQAVHTFIQLANFLWGFRSS